MILKLLIILFFVFLILWYPRYHYMYVFSKTQKRIQFDDALLETGDIIFMRQDNPLVYTSHNGINISRSYSKVATDSIAWYSQGHYTHVGVVVRIQGRSYVFHITSDLMIDRWTNQPKIGRPCLSTLDDINLYHGTLYLTKNPNSKSISEEKTIRALSNIYSKDYLFQGNMLTAIWNNGLKFGKNSNFIMCTDMVEIVLQELHITTDCSMNADIKSLLYKLDNIGYADHMQLENAYTKLVL
jgi:hypothetical protein